MSEALSYLNSMIDDNFSQIENIKRQYGVIKKIFEIEDTNKTSAKVKVKIRGITDDDLVEEVIEDAPDEKNWLTMLNKTGQVLKVGDAVWIHYWRSITDGYVAIKIGKPRKNTGKVKLERAMTITDHQDTIEKISEEIDDFQIQNKVARTYGNTPSVIYVWGCPAVFYPSVTGLPDIYSRTQATDFKNFILSLDSGLFIKDVEDICINTRDIGVGIDSQYYGHTNYHFGFLTRENYNGLDIRYISGGAIDEDDDRYDDIYNYFMSFFNYFPNGVGFLPDVMTLSKNNRLGSVFQDDTLNECITFSDYAAAVNGGLIFVYDEVIFDSSTMWAPFGFVRGRWVLRTFSQGILANTSNYFHPITGQQAYSVMSIRSLLMNIAFANNDEREYARQTLSRVESLPY